MISVAQALEQAVGHHQAGHFAAAEQLYRQILQVQPDHFDALHLLGVIACQFGRPEKGAEHITAALRINPLVAEAHNNLGNAFQSLGKISEAISAYRQALLINPNYAQPNNNLGNVFEEQDQLDKAIACYRQAITVQPDYADAYNNLGFALRVQGRLDEAAASYQQAIRLNPNSPEFHKNLGIIWLLQGNLKDGWTEYEWRFRGEGFSLQEYPRPLWDGTPLHGRTILIHPDQGLGDIINFVRYVPMVHKLGGRVLLPCSVELARLLKSCAGVEQIIPVGDSAAPVRRAYSSVGPAASVGQQHHREDTGRSALFERGPGTGIALACAWSTFPAGASASPGGAVPATAVTSANRCRWRCFCRFPKYPA